MIRKLLLTLKIVKPTLAESNARLRMHLYGLDEFQWATPKGYTEKETWS